MAVVAAIGDYGGVCHGDASTQDFAVAMLDEIENPKHRRVRFTAAN